MDDFNLYEVESTITIKMLTTVSAPDEEKAEMIAEQECQEIVENIDYTNYDIDTEVRLI